MDLTVSFILDCACLWSVAPGSCIAREPTMAFNDLNLPSQLWYLGAGGSNLLAALAEYRGVKVEQPSSAAYTVERFVVETGQRGVRLA